MTRIVRNTLLNYIPTDFATEQTINPLRIFELNNKPIRNGEIIYLCEREIRVKDNFALQIPKDFDLEAFLNRPYYGKSFEQAMSKQKPFLLVMGNTKYAHTMVRFIPVGEMVDAEFGHDFNFCIINTKMPENEELVEYFQPPNPKLPALYIVDTKQSEYVYIDKKYYTKRGIRKVLKKYLAGELF